MDIAVFIGIYAEPVSYGLCFLFMCGMALYEPLPKLKLLAVYYFLGTILMVKAAIADNNIKLYSLLSALTATAMCVYFFYTLTTRSKKIAVVVLYAANMLYFLASELTVTTVFDSGAFVLLSSSVVAMVFMFMHQTLSQVTEQPLSLNFDFWFACAQLVYHVGAFAIFLSNRYLSLMIIAENTMESRILFTELWGVHSVLLFLSSLIIAGSVLWIFYRNRSPLF
ncbi:MAG: hypothetical protein ACKOE5_02970 [Cytophagales bacterium]